jgi:phage N-6-adenine-methyltransferase
MPQQKPGRSKQDYSTPANFLRAVENRFGKIALDLAAHQSNHVVPRYYGSGGLYPDSLTAEWPLSNNLWLNPPFTNITPWARKCYESIMRPSSAACILFLVPASVGSNWFADWVHDKAYVLALKGRLCFDKLHPSWGFPKDCMLCVYASYYVPTFSVWDWKKDS